ncbi:hypothetical protein T07_6918 [Trichinella nelsoni]|uniref:Uncharacterized protein n=1 Tax=Trichinella nelsoni TaxID=6336 RepID=A0A0V0S925_9BILA|nr:hypothetical protein T07_6918 [Trichinella nelsoni]
MRSLPSFTRMNDEFLENIVTYNISHCTQPHHRKYNSHNNCFPGKEKSWASYMFSGRNGTDLVGVTHP